MARQRRRAQPWWAGLPTSELLDTRLCDLGLTIEGTALEARAARLQGEFAERGLRFRPHVWLSTDWFTPDGIAGFAVPFYLAHPRLVRLEHEEMFEVEGGTSTDCMKIMRHEAGHAVDNAYRIRRRQRFRELFGSSALPYRETYAPRTSSRDYVHHLDGWYAQSHPLEDFAETFAVWLTPRSNWRLSYAGWPAQRKLEYVDELMREIANVRPPVLSRARPDLVSRVRASLREHYRARRSTYSREPSSTYDPYLLRLFQRRDGRRRWRSAAKFLRRQRVELRNRVGDLTGQHRYLVDQVLRTLIVRCRELDLVLVRPEADARLSAAILVAVLTMRFLRGRDREFSR